MKKLRLLLALAALPLAACHGTKPATSAPHTVYHLKDGRYAYNDNGIWFYLWMMQGNQQTYVYGSSGVPASSYSSATWSRGAAPTTQQAAGAEEEQDEITTNPEGEPVAEEAEGQASPEAEAPSEGGTDGGSTADSSGGDSGGGGGDGGGGGGGE